MGGNETRYCTTSRVVETNSTIVVDSCDACPYSRHSPHEHEPGWQICNLLERAVITVNAALNRDCPMQSGAVITKVVTTRYTFLE